MNFPELLTPIKLQLGKKFTFFSSGIVRNGKLDAIVQWLGLSLGRLGFSSVSATGFLLPEYVTKPTHI